MMINSELIRRRIKELGYTRKGVADRAEISVRTLRAFIHEKDYGLPHEFTRRRLAKVLRVREEVLFPGVQSGEVAS